MLIAIIAPAQMTSEQVASVLERQEIEGARFMVARDIGGNLPASEIDKCVLVVQDQGVVSVGEQVGRVRESLNPEVELILCTPQPSAEARRMFIECGATEVVTPQSWSPIHVAERVYSQLALAGDVKPSCRGALRGATKEIRDLYRHIQTVAPLSEPVLILGETGTGKEIVAREIHQSSGRPDSYVPVNCPEISPELFNSELFGHVKGAFTGADKPRRGLVSEAGRGTVFLDEIGDLDPQAQAKLLRLLEERKVRRVGSDRWEQVEARIILATNRDLAEACREGKFRRDLFERIRGFTLVLPPLRERKADIPLLARHFVDDYNAEYSCQLDIPPGSIDPLFRYDWPGNVRELRSIIRKAAAYTDGSGYINSLTIQEVIGRGETGQANNAVTFDPSVDTFRDLQKRAQTAYFHALLDLTSGNKDAAIKLSGLSRSQFYEKLKEIQ